MRNSFLAAAAALTLAAAGAMAQNNTTQNDMKTNPPATNPMAMPPSTTTPAPAPKPNLVMPSGTPNFINVKSDDMLSSNVVGLDVYNDQNNDIGKIQDIVLDNAKKMTGYIVSVGGFLGMGTHYVAVDPDSVKVTFDAPNKVWRATMNATKDQLKAAPEFKYQGQWNASRS
jgi:sporulation protein YlmC with PRC-barrel domain